MKPRILSRAVSLFTPGKRRTQQEVTNSDREEKGDFTRIGSSEIQSAAVPVSLSEPTAAVALEVNAKQESEIIIGDIDAEANEACPMRVLRDNEPTKARYKAAIDQLERCFTRASTREAYPFIDFDEFRQTNQTIPYLREKVDQMLGTRQSPAKNGNILRRIFVAMTPFSKCLLLLTSQPVLSPSRCRN